VTKNTRRPDDAPAINTSATFLRRERALQRIGLGLLSLFVVAGLAGAFGNGPLAATTIRSGNITIRFERFTRQSFRTEFEVSIASVSTPTVTITIPRTFLDRIEMLETRPPESLKRLGDHVATFEVPATNGVATLVLHYHPRNYGVLHADVIAAQQPPVPVRQIVFF
jgi:hypothetical protein